MVSPIFLGSESDTLFIISALLSFLHGFTFYTSFFFNLTDIKNMYYVKWKNQVQEYILDHFICVKFKNRGN